MIQESIIFNELIHEKSPYLSQYIDNPVKWHKWTSEGFDKAKIENKPVFVFVGYFLCKECYKMKRECFLDVDVSKMLNENFISINVDKDEEPVIYNVCKEVCKSIKQEIKLPYVIIMTYDKNIFFAEGSLPKLKSDNKVGLIEVLDTISREWQEDNQKFINLGSEITNAVKRNLLIFEKRDILSNDAIDKAVCIYKYCFKQWQNNKMDKFKQIKPQNLLFLIDYYKKHHDEAVLDILQKMTNNMYQSELFDHIGLGFFEYANDRLALTKTLYNNALMSILFTEMYVITKNDNYKEVANKVLKYILCEFCGSSGGFLSQVAGDTEQREQEYYKFFPFEIINVLGDEDGERFNKYFNIKRDENGYLKALPSISQDSFRVDIDNLEEKILRVLNYRDKRGELIKDNRIFTAKNALLAAVFAKAYNYLKDDKYKALAREIVDFIEKNLTHDNGNLYIEYFEGERLGEGTIDEYAYLALSYIQLYDATFCREYVDKASLYANKIVELFGKDDEAGFYFSKTDNNDILFNLKVYKDDSIISGNSIATYVFYRLYDFTGNVRWKELAKRQVQNIMGNIYEEPLKYSLYLIVLNRLQ